MLQCCSSPPRQNSAAFMLKTIAESESAVMKRLACKSGGQFIRHKPRSRSGLVVEWRAQRDALFGEQTAKGGHGVEAALSAAVPDELSS